MLDNVNNDYVFTSDPFDSVDVFWNDFSKVGEIKYRSGYCSTDKVIVENGVMLEKPKYEGLMKYTSLSGLPSFYITFFNDGVGVAFEVSKLNKEDLKWYQKPLPKSTNGDNTKIMKMVCDLPLSKGTVFKYE